MNDSRQALGISPEQGPQPKENSSANRPTRLAIRLWTPTRLTVRWSSDGPLIYLLTDLISAGNGFPVETSDPVLIAQFEHSGQAYRTARRLQWALFEFCQRRPDECLGVAAILYDGMDSASRQEGPRQVSALLQRTRPAQILATTSVTDQLQALPGLQLRSMTSTPGSRGEWQGGAQEVLWTKVSNLEQIQERLKEIARTAIQNQELTSKADPAPPPMPVSDQPTVDFSHAGGYRSAPTIVSEEQPPALPEAIEEMPPEPIPDLLEPEEEESGSRTLWLSLSAIVAVAILALLLLPRLRNKQADAPAASPQTQPLNQEPLSPQPEPVSKSQPAISTPQQEPVQQQPVSVPTPKPAEAPKSSVRHPSSESPTRSQSKKVTEYDGMSEKDIPMLLRMAEKKAGAGDYDDARRIFETVLHLDPSNAEAKLGLKKLDLSEREAR